MYKLAQKCRCCGCLDLVKYLNLGLQPLANSYHKGENMSAYFPLEVMLCQQCFHSQLSIVVDPNLMFENYLYVSGTTETFRNHCKEFAEYAMNVCPNQGYITVLDIAANDGTLLSCFEELGCFTLGVDPAKNLKHIAEKNGIDIISSYWDDVAVRKINNKYHMKFDVITGTNVFAHVDNIFDFLVNCESVLNDNGVVILEFPYCDQMINKIEFDTVYHEHLSYFLVTSFATLAYKARFVITDVLQTPIHGGSIRFVLQPMNDVNSLHCEKVNQLITNERSAGLHKLSTYKKFSDRVYINNLKLNEFINNTRNIGHFKVVGYGASAKGNTMLNHFNVNLDYIVDDNPMKIGFMTPGMNIPIKSTDALKEDTPLAIVILSWNFYDEIKRKIIALREGKTTILIKYVPHFETELC